MVMGKVTTGHFRYMHGEIMTTASKATARPT